MKEKEKGERRRREKRKSSFRSKRRRDVCTDRLQRVFEFFGKYWTSSSTGRVYLNTALHVFVHGRGKYLHRDAESLCWK